MKSYREWNPRQNLLLPPSLMDWLPNNHPVYFVLDVVEGLDLSAIEDTLQAKDHRGARPLPPKMMVGLLLYGYSVGIFSSRKMERATYESIPFRVLCGGNHPDHSTISGFRKRFSEAREAGLVKLGHVALDGTKMAANGSKHKANSYERMKVKEKQLESEITALLEEADKADAAEDARHGKDKRGDELPAELQHKEKRRRKIKAAKEALEAEAARAHAEHKRKLADQAAIAAEEADEASRERAEERASRAEKVASESAYAAVEKAKKRLEHAAEEAERLAESAQSRSERCQAASARQSRKDAQRGLERARQVRCPEAAESSESLPEHHVPFDRHGNPKPSAQINYVDCDQPSSRSGASSANARDGDRELREDAADLLR